MRDEFYGQFWAENHNLLSDGISNALRNLAYRFRRRTPPRPVSSRLKSRT